MTENNKKYIAKAWIEDGEEEEFKKSFLKSLIAQWQGHGNDFNADMVDKMHWIGEDETDGIKNYIDKATENIMCSFSIGYTFFTTDVLDYYLGFDAIKLYSRSNLIEGHENDIAKKLPWEEGFERKEDDISEKYGKSLINVFDDLYRLVYLFSEEEGEEGLTNKEIFENFKEKISTMNDKIGFLYNHVKDGGLDADSTNGIRFFIYTQEDYDRMVANNDPIVTRPNHIIFIKSPEELAAGGFVGGRYTGNLDSYEISQYYDFRVFTGDDGKTWLQYKHDSLPDEEEYWHNMEETKNFLDEEAIKQDVKTVLMGDDYSLNANVFNNTINNMTATDIANNALSNYSKGKFITGGIYNNEKLPIIEDLNGFKLLKLDDYTTNLTNQINSQIQTVDDKFIGVNRDILSLQNADTSYTSQINNLNTRLNELDEKLDIINQSIGEAKASINNISKWESYSFDGKLKNAYTSLNMYNEALGLGFLYVNFIMYIPKSLKPGWVQLRKNSTTLFEKRQVKAIPNSNIVFHAVGLPKNALLRIDTETKPTDIFRTGEIIYYHPAQVSKDVSYNIFGHVLYKYSKLNNDL